MKPIFFIPGIIENRLINGILEAFFKTATHIDMRLVKYLFFQFHLL